MNEDPVDALVATAADGIDFDGLRVEDGNDGYAFETPDSSRSGLSETDLRAVAADSPHVDNWYFWHATAPQTDARWAFLRWLEGADEHGVTDRYDALGDGLATEWGQLRITVTLDDDGGRTYALCHVDDAATPPAALNDYEDPLDARDLAKEDDDGRYRPLKTAPSLQTGWVFPDLSASDLVEAVEYLYPATVANWHREREGELDVTHWRETAERQTGIYGIIDELDTDAVVRIAQTCCEDSQCVKRREWEFDGETPLEADGGDGPFPCREPCSLVVAAARKWTTLEREDEREYTFTLTESEKEQLEALIDAVADDEVGDIREADVYEGANRYRTRYLRAKRMVDGDLCGVPSDPHEAADGADEEASADD